MTAHHILIPIHDFNAGGTEAIAFRLAGAWLKAGHRVTILAGASDGPMRARVPAGTDIHLLEPERRRSPLSRLFLGRPMADAAKGIAPDIIFIPGNFHFILAAAFKAALPRVPIVAKISNPLTGGTGPLDRLGIAWWTRGIDLLAAMAPGLEADARMLLPGRAVTTIHDPFLDDEVAVIARAQLPSPDRPLRLLAIGRLEPQKDFRLAIDVLAALRRRREACLTILGEGKERPVIEAHVRRHDLGEHVDMPGHVADITPYIDTADLLLISSRYEGGPAVAVEALARGLPFVATDCSHLLREMVAAQPEVGMLVGTRDAAALADAVQQVAFRNPPSRAAIERTTAAHGLSAAAARYLMEFNALPVVYRVKSGDAGRAAVPK